MKKGEGAQAKIFWLHFSQFRGFLKEFGENRGLVPLSILYLTNLCADRGLEVGLAYLLCLSGGGGGGGTPQPLWFQAQKKYIQKVHISGLASCATAVRIK